MNTPSRDALVSTWRRVIRKWREQEVAQQTTGNDKAGAQQAGQVNREAVLEKQAK